MATAGVSYIIGREANAKYNETLNGVQTQKATKHQLQPGIDPYLIKGDSTSGLLPGIDPLKQELKESDHRIQAYCFRMCNTTHETNRLPFTKPNDYCELNFELLLRNFEAAHRLFLGTQLECQIGKQILIITKAFRLTTLDIIIVGLRLLTRNAIVCFRITFLTKKD